MNLCTHGGQSYTCLICQNAALRKQVKAAKAAELRAVGRLSKFKDPLFAIYEAANAWRGDETLYSMWQFTRLVIDKVTKVVADSTWRSKADE